MKTAAKYWGIAIATGVTLIGLGLIELMLRRDAGPSAYLLNKSVAGTAFIMILLSFTFSAIHHFWGPFKTTIALRRPFGLFGYGLAVLHVCLTFLTKDPSNIALQKFPFPAFFIDHWFAIALALMSFGYFTYAFKISIWPGPMLQRTDTARLWRKRLRYGYLAVLLVFIHAAILKFEGWIQWMDSYEPALPPLSLIVACLGVGLIFLKAVHLVSVKRFF